MVNIVKLAEQSYNIAVKMAPLDTGNLRQRGIQLFVRHNGFTIFYNGNTVPYIEYNQGPKGPPKNHGFIGRTRTAILANINNELNGIRNNVNSNPDNMAELLKDNPAMNKTLIDTMKHQVRRS